PERRTASKRPARLKLIRLGKTASNTAPGATSAPTRKGFAATSSTLISAMLKRPAAITPVSLTFKLDTGTSAALSTGKRSASASGPNKLAPANAFKSKADRSTLAVAGIVSGTTGFKRRHVHAAADSTATAMAKANPILCANKEPTTFPHAGSIQ